MAPSSLLDSRHAARSLARHTRGAPASPVPRHVWGTTVNPAVKLLLFTLAFDELGLNRVALRCDARNTCSHRAIARLGATYEGTLRAFRPAADGTIADVDYFSVLAAEWPTVRAGLLTRLGTAA